MNIFYLHPDPVQAASQICVVHQNKMLVESCQLLSTAHHVLDGDESIDGIYKSSHVNHPSAVWVRENYSHYMWLLRYSSALADLYRKRTGKWHKCEDVLQELYDNHPQNIRVLGHNSMTEPPACVDADIKRMNISTIQKYRKQINRKYEEWLSRAKPVKVEAYPSKPEWWSV